jgi:hypothetical protein
MTKTFSIRQTKVGVETVVGELTLEGSDENINLFVISLEFAMNEKRPKQRLHIMEKP